MKKQTKIICYVLSSLIFLIPLTLIILEWQLNYRYNLPYKESNLTFIEYNIKEPNNTTKESLTTEINELFDNPSYKLQFSNLASNTYGECNIFSRTITIKNNISNVFYVFALAHELVHLEYFTYCERFCNLQAYKILFDSNNNYFKNVALYFADNDSMWSYDYKFKGYIIDSQGNYRR